MSLKKTKFPKYDDVPYIGRFRWCTELIREQKLVGRTLVDVGSSTGLQESKILDLKFKKLIAFDPFEPAVEYAKRQINDKRISFFVSTADKIPAKDNSADVVTIFDVIEHVPKNTELEVFKEVNRVLKKGGIMLLTTPNNNLLTNLLDPAWYLGHRHYKATELESLVEKSGLKVRHSEVRGSIWSSVYMLWFYIMKWIFGKTLPRNRWIETKEDVGYDSKGIFTLFIEAIK